MVSCWNRTVRVAALGVATLVLCQCETKRTVKSTRTSFGFSEAMWGGQGGGTDEGEIRSKFAEKGYTIAEDGSIKADKPNLYADQKARGMDGAFNKKEAKFRNREARTKEFRTPEYIERQQFAGADSAREDGSRAREADFAGSRDRQANKLFAKRDKASSELAVFETGADRAAGTVFGTQRDAVGSEAIANAPIAEGQQRAAGYADNASMSLDDVKKMLDPGDYARKKDL